MLTFEDDYLSDGPLLHVDVIFIQGLIIYVFLRLNGMNEFRICHYDRRGLCFSCTKALFGIFDGRIRLDELEAWIRLSCVERLVNFPLILCSESFSLMNFCSFGYHLCLWFSLLNFVWPNFLIVQTWKKYKSEAFLYYLFQKVLYHLTQYYLLAYFRQNSHEVCLIFHEC